MCACHSIRSSVRTFTIPENAKLPNSALVGPLMTSISRMPPGKITAPIVVALGVAVHRLVHRHAVDPEREIGGVIGAEAAQRDVGAEPRALTLQMHLDPGGLAEQLVWASPRASSRIVAASIDVAATAAHVRRARPRW